MTADLSLLARVISVGLSTDTELQAAWVVGLRRGDADCYKMVVESTIGRLLNVARRYLEEDDARDAVQETFITLHASIDKFKGKSTLLTWLQRILINECLQRLRKLKSLRETPIENLLPEYLDNGHRANPGSAWPDSSNQVLDREQRCEAVMENVKKLPITHRTVIMLRDFDGLSGQETADALEISVAAVKVRLHRARQALRELLEPVILGEIHDL